MVIIPYILHLLSLSFLMFLTSCFFKPFYTTPTWRLRVAVCGWLSIRQRPLQGCFFLVCFVFFLRGGVHLYSTNDYRELSYLMLNCKTILLGTITMIKVNILSTTLTLDDVLEKLDSSFSLLCFVFRSISQMSTN